MIMWYESDFLLPCTRDVCGYYKQFFDDYECNCMLDEAIDFGSWQFGGGGNNGDGGGAEGN
jgi:hypothetical protein